MTDIRLDDDYQLAIHTNGDMGLITGVGTLLQSIKLEAASSENDLWYDPEWGWSLLDFAQAQQTELIKLEIEQRCRQKLEAHEEIAVDSIGISVSWTNDSITADVAFRLLGSDELVRLNINIGRTQIEVIDID